MYGNIFLFSLQNLRSEKGWLFEPDKPKHMTKSNFWMACQEPCRSASVHLSDVNPIKCFIKAERSDSKIWVFLQERVSLWLKLN